MDGVVGLAEDAQLPEETIKIARQETSSGDSSALISINGPGPVIELADPEVGDTIYVVPLKQVGAGRVAGEKLCWISNARNDSGHRHSAIS